MTRDEILARLAEMPERHRDPVLHATERSMRHPAQIDARSLLLEAAGLLSERLASIGVDVSEYRRLQQGGEGIDGRLLEAIDAMSRRSREAIAAEVWRQCREGVPPVIVPGKS